VRRRVAAHVWSVRHARVDPHGFFLFRFFLFSFPSILNFFQADFFFNFFVFHIQHEIHVYGFFQKMKSYLRALILICMSLQMSWQIYSTPSTPGFAGFV